MFKFLFKILVLIFIISAFINYYVGVKPYKGPVTDHFDGERFHNLESDNATSTE